MAKPQTLTMPSLILTLLLIAIPLASAAVSSIDLGSESLKIAVVNLKPGQSPISIALSPMSKRKSPSLVAFPSPNHRLLSEEAAAVQARSPHRVFSHLRDILAKPHNYVKSYLNSLYLPFDVVEDPSRGNGFRIRVEEGDSVNVFSIEELVAMVLGYGMGLADTHVRGKVKDAVIAVPVYYGQAERRGIMQAAELAGINVLSLIHEHAGAALQYGIDKDFANESRYVVFYDMGAGSTYAALVYFSAYNAKEFGKTVSINQFQVKDVRWDSRLGGQDMEMRLVEYFADEFNSKVGNGVDIRKSPKAMAKLKKQVKRTKEILSANTMAPISVESLLDDIDFRSSITREKFEELCSDLWERALVPLKEVIKHSGLKLEEIYAVELIGGATRVPKLQATLQEFLGRKDLDKHLDADEAIALGASLHAANISDGIKLNRKLGMIDGSPYGFLLEIVGADLKDENTDMLLVPRMKKLGIKLFRSIKYNKDFEVSLSYESSSDLPPGASSTKFAEYSVLGLTEASEKYSTRNLSAPIKANLHFSLSKSGILSLDRAEAVIEISEWVEVPKKNETLETDNKVINATEKSTEVNSEDKAEALNLEDPVISSNATSDDQDPVVTTEKVLKKKTFRVPLQVVEKSTGPVAVLSKDAFSEAKTRLEALDRIDAERRKTAELKNNLEEYIYSMKEKIEENVELHKVSTEQERQSFIEKLNEVQEWLYSDGEDASANEFKERLEMLKAIGDPIFFRLSELKARPLASENTKTYLAELQKIVSNWETNKPWLPKSRVDEVLKEAESLKSWLDDKEELQKKTSEFTAPVFTSDEVYDKFFKLQDKVGSVNRIPKPKPKIEKPYKQENVSQENNTDTSSSDSQDPTGSKQQRDSDGSATENTEQEVHDEL